MSDIKTIAEYLLTLANPIEINDQLVDNAESAVKELNLLQSTDAKTYQQIITAYNNIFDAEREKQSALKLAAILSEQLTNEEYNDLPADAKEFINKKIKQSAN